MRPTLYLLVLIHFFSAAAIAQTLHCSAGSIYPHLFNWGGRSGHFQSQYSSKLGYSFNLALEDLPFNDFPMRLSLDFGRQQNQIHIEDGGLGGGHRSDANIDKYLLGVSACPIHLKIPHVLHLFLGGYFNMVVHDNSTGNKLSWLRGTPDLIAPFKPRTFPINRTGNFGLAAILSCPIPLKSGYALVPTYTCHLGLTPEYTNNIGTSSPKLIRHQFSLGISKQLKPPQKT